MASLIRAFLAFLPCLRVTAYCSFGESCWPAAAEWNALSATLEGSLHNFGPSAYDTCPVTDNAFDKLDSNGGLCMQYRGCSNHFCSASLGSNLPRAGVEATSISDVQEALAFANKHNLAVVVKTTGHSFFGSSTRKDALLIWTRKLPSSLTNGVQSFSDSCGTEHAHTIAAGGGDIWADVYAAVGEAYDIIGGGSGSVSAVGGWLQGGGLSSLSRYHGLGIDNVIRFEAVLANGSHVVADACTNSDLFWALRGGGGGTFGVVVSARYRVHEAKGLTYYEVTIGNGLVQAPRAVWRSWFSFWVNASVNMDLRWGGYWTLNKYMLYFLGDQTDASITLMDNISLWRDALPPEEQRFVSISTPSVAPSYFEFRGKRAGIISTADKTGAEVMDIRSRVVPLSWVVGEGAVAVDFLMSLLMDSNRCLDWPRPLAGFQLGKDIESWNCSYYAAFYGVGNGACDANVIKASSNCDADCQKDPTFIVQRCPVTCGFCDLTCKDDDYPLASFGLYMSCSDYASLYGVGSGTCDINKIKASKACDASCQDLPDFIHTVCPVTCGVCMPSSSQLLQPSVTLFNYMLGGAVNNVAPEDTAINPAFRQSVWQIEAFGDAGADMFRRLRALVPMSKGAGAGYNHASMWEPQWPEAFWGANLPRLQSLKRLFDPQRRLQSPFTVGYEPQGDGYIFEFLSSMPRTSPQEMPIALSRGSPEAMEDAMYLTTGWFDWKPMPSPNDTEITFFRCRKDRNYLQTGCYAGHTAVMVMSSNGSNVRELTDYTFANWNPSWMRDGSGRVIWTRMTGEGIRGWITCSSCSAGQELQLSSSSVLDGLEGNQMEWAHSSFKDGRVLMIRISDRSASGGGYSTSAFALTINQIGGDNIYEEFSLSDMSWSGYVHKVFLSASERYLAYLKNGAEGEDFKMSQLFYCSVDSVSMVLQNEVAITDVNPSFSQWYARFTPDDQHIIYAADKDGFYHRIYAYSLLSRSTRVLTQQKATHWYPCPLGMTTPVVLTTATTTGLSGSPSTMSTFSGSSAMSTLSGPTTRINVSASPSAMSTSYGRWLLLCMLMTVSFSALACESAARVQP